MGTAALLSWEIRLLPYGLILTTPEGCWPRDTRHSHSTGDAAQHTAAVCSQNQGPLCSCSEQHELRGWALAALWSRVSSSPITPSSAPKSHPPPLGLDAAPQLRELPPSGDRGCCHQNPSRAPLLLVLAKGTVKSSMPRDPRVRPQTSSPHQSTPVHSRGWGLGALGRAHISG